MMCWNCCGCLHTSEALSPNLTTFFRSCPIAQKETEEANTALVRDFVETIFNERDLEAADDYLVENYHEYATGNGESFQSREEFKSGNAEFFQAFPDLRVTEAGCIDEGDTVVYRHAITGTHEREIMGVEPTGNEIRQENAGVFRIEDGTIADLYLYADNISLMRQLGIIPESAGVDRVVQSDSRLKPVTARHGSAPQRFVDGGSVRLHRSRFPEYP